MFGRSPAVYKISEKGLQILIFFRKILTKLAMWGQLPMCVANVWKNLFFWRCRATFGKISEFWKFWETPARFAYTRKIPKFWKFSETVPNLCRSWENPGIMDRLGKIPKFCKVSRTKQNCRSSRTIFQFFDIYTEIIWEIFGKYRYVFKFGGKIPRILHTFRKKVPNVGKWWGISSKTGTCWAKSSKYCNLGEILRMLEV